MIIQQGQEFLLNVLDECRITEDMPYDNKHVRQVKYIKKSFNSEICFTIQHTHEEEAACVYSTISSLS